MKITMADDFVQHKVLPEHRAIVRMLRQSIGEYAPRAREVVTYGILGWKGNKMIAVISPTKKDITLAFSRGAEFEDKYGLLQGVGKVSKHVKIRSLNDVNKAAIRYYTKQALDLDAT